MEEGGSADEDEKDNGYAYLGSGHAYLSIELAIPEAEGYLESRVNKY